MSQPWDPRSRRILAPVLGGPRDGDIVDIDPKARVYTMVDRVSPHGFMPVGSTSVFDDTAPTTHYEVRLATAILPGRTDRQRIRVLVHPRWLPLLDNPMAAEAILQVVLADALKRGWRAPDDQSEFWPDGPYPTDDERVYMALWMMVDRWPTPDNG